MAAIVYDLHEYEQSIDVKEKKRNRIERCVWFRSFLLRRGVCGTEGGL